MRIHLLSRGVFCAGDRWGVNAKLCETSGWHVRQAEHTMIRQGGVPSPRETAQLVPKARIEIRACHAVIVLCYHWEGNVVWSAVVDVQHVRWPAPDRRGCYSRPDSLCVRHGTCASDAVIYYEKFQLPGQAGILAAGLRKALARALVDKHVSRTARGRFWLVWKLEG